MENAPAELDLWYWLTLLATSILIYLLTLLSNFVSFVIFGPAPQPLMAAKFELFSITANVVIGLVLMTLLPPYLRALVA